MLSNWDIRQVYKLHAACQTEWFHIKCDLKHQISTGLREKSQSQGFLERHTKFKCFKPHWNHNHQQQNPQLSHRPNSTHRTRYYEPEAIKINETKQNAS